MSMPVGLDEVWGSLSKSDKEVVRAALWAALDVHSPVDSLSAEQFDRLELLANFVNKEDN